MKKLILSLGLLLFALAGKSQILTYKADSFYCFYVPSNLNPFVEFIEHREFEDSGRKGRVDYIFNENDKSVTVKTNTYKYVYKMVEKDTSDSKVTRYTVRDGYYEFYFLVSKQPGGINNLYCFYPDGPVNRGWQAVIQP